MFSNFRLLDLCFFNDKQCRSRSVLQKLTDVDLHCLLRQGMSCSAREGSTLTALQIKTDTYANSVDPDELITSDLIRIYIVYYFILFLILH